MGLSFPSALELSWLDLQRFWRWYVASGVSKEQLQSEWDVWLMLLATEAGSCTFDQSALDILLMDKSAIPTLCDSSACPVAIKFSCSSLDEFVRRFQVHCASDYQHWRNEEVTEQNTKKLGQAALMEQTSSISFMCRMSVHECSGISFWCFIVEEGDNFNGPESSSGFSQFCSREALGV